MAALISLLKAGGVMRAGDIDAAVERALPYLEKEGTWWIEEKECVSCHHTSFFVWAKDLAREAGHEVDVQILNEQRNWMWQALLAPKVDNKTGEEDPKLVVGDANVEGLAQILLSPSRKHLSAETVESFIEIISSNRQDDGNWKPGGQLPRQERPGKETQWISNQWIEAAMLSVESTVSDGKTGNDKAETNEWYAMNVLLDPDKASVSALLERQNDDGGWSWIDGENSSPTGTGQALFALARAGELEAHPDAVAKGRKYLLESQAEDGHWKTFSTKDRAESGRVSNFWGTSWAVIGLLESDR
ncbi:MAG: hypothetical protein ACPGFB_05040 [Verrucomicrobiales bacterium]